MAFELSRVDRLTKTYDLAARFPDLDGPFTAAEVALLPPRANPNGATLWDAAGVTAGVASVMFAGPDADSSGAVVVTGSADLWLRVTVGSEVDAVKVERITLLGSGTVIAPGPLPQVLTVQGRTGAVVLDAADVGAVATGAGAGGALSGTYPSPGLNETTVDSVVAGKVGTVGSATDVALKVGYVRGERSPDDPDFRQFPVVMLHNFISLTDAQGVLKDYKAWGYETIFFSQMMDYLRTGDATGIPEKPLVLTCDDGGISGYQYFYPALTEFGMKATLFVVPDWISGTITTPPNGGTFLEASAFTWANAVEMFASGRVEFQSHTKTHGSMRLLSGAGVFAGNGEGAGADYLAAKAAIETNVPGANVQYNAAPYGVINETAIASLKAAGCKGNRITQCGKGYDGVYDGSGPTAFTLPSTDPFRVPIASDGSLKALKQANVYGTADPDGNRIQNGKFLVSSRGWTLPGGWTFATVTLPDGTTGPALRGFGVAAATGASHTDLIPVGYYGQFAVDFYLQATLGGATSARVVLDCYDTINGTLVKTLADPPGAQTSNTSWTRKRWSVLGDGTYAWIRPRFEVVGATASSEMLVWDVKVRSQRNALSTGSPRPIA